MGVKGFKLIGNNGLQNWAFIIAVLINIHQEKAISATWWQIH